MAPRSKASFRANGAAVERNEGGSPPIDRRAILERSYGSEDRQTPEAGGISHRRVTLTGLAGPILKIRRKLGVARVFVQQAVCEIRKNLTVQADQLGIVGGGKARDAS